VQEAEQLIREFRDMAIGKLDIGSQPNHLGRSQRIRRRARSAIASEMRDPAVAHIARRAEFRSNHFHEGDRDPVATANQLMPKIADLEYTPNPNARKFVLKEPLTNGLARSFENAEQAQRDELATKLFAIRMSPMCSTSTTGSR